MRIALVLLAAWWALTALPAGAQTAPARVTPRTLERLLLLDVARAGSRLVAVGEHGAIITAQHLENGWQRASSATETTLTAVHFADDLQGWAVGHDATIVHSSDGGLSWQRQHVDTQAQGPLLDVWFKDSQQGFAVGAYGAFLQTRDGGRTWRQRRITADDRHFNAIAGGTDARLYLAGEGGLLYASDDLGEHWRVVAVPYTGSFFGLLRLPGNGLLVFGMRGKIFRSPDGGASWQAARSEQAAILMAGAVAADGVIWLAGLGGTLLLSRDQGVSFAPLRQPGGKSISALLPLSPAQVLLVGDGGVRSTKAAF